MNSKSDLGIPEYATITKNDDEIIVGYSKELPPIKGIASASGEDLVPNTDKFHIYKFKHLKTSRVRRVL